MNEFNTEEAFRKLLFMQVWLLCENAYVWY